MKMAFMNCYELLAEKPKDEDDLTDNSDEIDKTLIEKFDNNRHRVKNARSLIHE